MDKIRDVRFDNRKLEPLGVETLTLAELQTRATPQQLARPERIDFYLLILFTSGKGVHLLDFVRYEVRARSLILIQPRQVQQYVLKPSLKGRLLLIDPVILRPHLEPDGQSQPLTMDWPTWSKLSVGLNAEALRVFDQVAQETDSSRGDDFTPKILQHLVLSLLLRIQRFAGQEQSAPTPHQGRTLDLWRMLRHEVEQSYQRERSVRYYARRLGYSEKTLTRACLELEGRTAKDAIDQRVALEAKRLLAHTDWSAVDIGFHLGFSEQTNFVKFFRRTAGEAPSAFRSRFRVRSGRRSSPKGVGSLGT
ncbi:MAG: helix-turn-helix transcriptional regulator [Acidobacteria bacterium]|nr:helix-turn-helix transcriptional regulator [Acidobacteriota bacterium]